MKKFLGILCNFLKKITILANNFLPSFFPTPSEKMKILKSYPISLPPFSFFLKFSHRKWHHYGLGLGRRFGGTPPAWRSGSPPPNWQARACTCAVFRGMIKRPDKGSKFPEINGIWFQKGQIPKPWEFLKFGHNISLGNQRKSKILF